MKRNWGCLIPLIAFSLLWTPGNVLILYSLVMSSAADGNDNVHRWQLVGYLLLSDAPLLLIWITYFSWRRRARSSE